MAAVLFHRMALLTHIVVNTCYSYWASQRNYTNQFKIEIFDVNNNSYGSTTINKDITQTVPTSLTYSVYLCPGIYFIKGNIFENYQASTEASYSDNSYLWQ